jgi:hypothetical protein
MAKKKAKRKYTKREKKPLVLPNLDRRMVRYILFRIKDGAEDGMDRDRREHAEVIKKHFDAVLEEKGYAWSRFTFDWDVSPVDPYRVINRDLRLWVDEGGSFIGRPPGMSREAWGRHVLSQLMQNFETAPLPTDPPGFTKQA